jgi:hypothetical protein
MCERFGNNLALRHPLQPVVADRRSGMQAFFGVAGLEQPPLRCVMSPDAGVAIRLQLDALTARSPGGRLRSITPR